MEQKIFRVLLCEDDQNLGMVLKNFLELHDFDVTLERDGRLGLAAFQRETFDICLLDVMMPQMDGFTLAEEIRDINNDVPLFFITAKTLKEDVVKGYQLGADDYITKPFDSQVLLSKITQAVLRNEELNREVENKEYELGDILISPKRKLLQYKDGTTIELSPKEVKLARVLLESLNELVPREKALKKIWGSDTYFNGRSMDVYIVRLRKYLRPEPRLQIVNVHGTGFKLMFYENTTEQQ